MGSLTRFRGYSLVFAAVLLSGCGAGDSGGLLGGGGHAKDAGAGGGTGTGDGSAGANTGGASTGGDNSTGGAATGGSSGSGGVNSGGTSDGSAGGSSGAGGTGPSLCGAVVCDPVATCSASSPRKCVCPSGYADTNGDGTVCLKQDSGACSADADCANHHCVGGSCCAVACTTPGACEKLAGTVCVSGATCQYAKQLDKTPCDDGNLCTTNSCFNGVCSLDATKTCSDGNACTGDVCNPATGACTNPALNCNDNNPCTTDTCDVTKGCQYTPNAASCNDGDLCTTGDVCTSGVCKGTAKDCTSLNTSCATGVCTATTGACQAQPKNANGACANGLDACSTTGKCNATGTCVGQNDACGAIATGCATCTTGVTCFGAPTGRDCTCPATSGGTPVLEQNGQCVLNTDECAAAPCVALATACNDPSSAPNNVVCTCPAGYTGDGKKTGTGCVDVNECLAATNPCGAGVTLCTNLPPPARYSCTCKAGYRSLPTPTGPVCGCDLAGTFASFVTVNVSWPSIQNGAIEASPPGGVNTYSWSLRDQAVAANGTMTVTTVPCGGVSPTLCDSNILFNAAHAQFQPNQSWGKPRLRSGFQPVGPLDTHTTIPGGTYSEPQTATLMGIDLKDPAGVWPPCRECVGTALGMTCTCPDNSVHTVTNPATWWSNAEGTGALGITTMDVSTGGESIDGTFPDPPIDYPEPSECPRNSGGTKYNYREWPGLVPPLGLFSAYQWYVGSRGISAFSSTSVTFDAAASACVIAGNVTGPDAGRPHADARIAGCETGSQTSPGAACSVAQTDSYDGVNQGQVIGASTFKIEKFTLPTLPAQANPPTTLAGILAMPESATKDLNIVTVCNAVRVKYCPPGKVCQ
jgi:hypothetical protein